MSSKTSILITGATGYIGGTVLARLLQHPNASSLDITVLVRSAEKGKILEEKFGVKAVIGSYHEHDKLASLAESAQVVFQIADCDDVPLITAVLKGMKARYDKLNEVPILIHTSGTGVLVDQAWGEYVSESIHIDTDIEQIKSIPPEAPHRPVDLRIVEADRAGYIRGHIILPGVVYGIATHAVVSAGVSSGHSLAVPILSSIALVRKRASVVGPGKSLWPAVHVDDTADLFLELFDAIRTRPDAAGHGWEGFYFAENGEYSWYALGRAIQEAIVAKGLSDTDDPEPTPLTKEEMLQFCGSEEAASLWGSNARCRAERGRALGWKPRYTIDDMMKGIAEEVGVYADRYLAGEFEGKTNFMQLRIGK